MLKTESAIIATALRGRAAALDAEAATPRTLADRFEQGELPQARTFELRAEAACCIWENLLDRTLIAAPESKLKTTLTEMMENLGSGHMRHVAITLADLCCDTYETIGDETAQKLLLHAYDWDFVPAFVAALDWETAWQHTGVSYGYPTRPTPANLAATITTTALYLKAAEANGWNHESEMTPEQYCDVGHITPALYLNT